LIQMVDLLQLAAAVLIQLAVARQNVQFLEQLNRLAGTDFRNCWGGRSWVITFRFVIHVGCLLLERTCACKIIALDAADSTILVHRLSRCQFSELRKP